MNDEERELFTRYSSWSAEEVRSALTTQRMSYKEVALSLLESVAREKGLPLPEHCAECSCFFYASDAGCPGCADIAHAKTLQAKKAINSTTRATRWLKAATLSAFAGTMVVVVYDVFRLIETIRLMSAQESQVHLFRVTPRDVLLSQVMFLSWRLATALFFIAFYFHQTKTQQEKL